ncbi:glycerol-3-phosphate dehydrogenase [NAD(+)]-like [Gossypium australe]|uniref:Glycerol-3-phosphate dehydrogenase [NAD(+)] n=1 Tax=Gossypium australe TaxID=47621 RepID=A0A5B6V5A0_9ROSI|nr:glycerol-3-phosphate dehydrogenase [NAD(+)]-like [Gossypium australe]
MTPAFELEGETATTHHTNSANNGANDNQIGFKSRVSVIGSGSWGSVAAKLVAFNTLNLSSFHDEVKMWVFEETLQSGEKLTDAINRTNENIKYLPGIKLGKNVIADPDLDNAQEDVHFVYGHDVYIQLKMQTCWFLSPPHQFIDNICKSLVGKVRSDAEAISLIKGMEVKIEGPCLISTYISEQLGINCSVLMGANLANEIAEEKFSEATVGYRNNREIAEQWVQLFTTPYFMVTPVQDVEGVELCGTLKNVVAIAAGFVDGLDMGNNMKAAIIKFGLREMRDFCKLLFSSVKDDTFFESCGVADVITTCFGGRNRKVAEAFAKNGGKRSFDELEAEMLQGQKLQGVPTAREVYEVLRHWGLLELFPLFATVHEICSGCLPPSAIVIYSEKKPRLPV